MDKELKIIKKEYGINSDLINDVFSALNYIMSEMYKMHEDLSKFESVINMLNKIEEKYHEHPYLFYALKEATCLNYNNLLPKEKDIHAWFKNNIEKISNNTLRVVYYPMDNDNKPDFFVKDKHNKLFPVEIKLNEFNDAALKQLERYIDFYNCEKGIAIGSSLKCCLPSNVVFYNYDKPINVTRS